MFGENKSEYYQGNWLNVEKTEKYEQSKKKALEIIERYESIAEGDFWILKNYNKYKNVMSYSGLIMSHNGCLKLNDELDEKDKFKPSCVREDKDGYGNSLVFHYCNDEQGIYEVGEFSKANSSQTYPYAMAYKRLFDRVVLKNSRLAYDGIYSEVEADEFKQPQEEAPPDAKEKGVPEDLPVEEQKKLVEDASERDIEVFKKICADAGLDYKYVWTKTGKAKDMSEAHLAKATKWVIEHKNAGGEQ